MFADIIRMSRQFTGKTHKFVDIAQRKLILDKIYLNFVVTGNNRSYCVTNVLHTVRPVYICQSSDY